jgi:hypothetical protein
LLNKSVFSIAQAYPGQSNGTGGFVIFDSAGNQAYGYNQWHQEKHNEPARSTWRNLHLAADETHYLFGRSLSLMQMRNY